MKVFQTLYVISTFLILVSGCEKTEGVKNPNNILEKSGMLGTWEIESYEINGILDPSIKCCDFIEFSEDGKSNDFYGLYQNFGIGVVSTGIFFLNPGDSTISFGEAEDYDVYNYLLNDDLLQLKYVEDSAQITSSYRKNKLVRLLSGLNK